MKRALSFILALTLALSLLPTFAMAVDMEPAEIQSFSINFTGADTTEITAYDSSHDYYNKRWYVVRGDKLKGEDWEVLTTKNDSSIYKLESEGILAGTTAKSLVQYYLSGNEKYIPIAIPANVDISEYNTLAIKIIVPASGTYTLSAAVWGSASGGKAEILVNGKSFGTKSLNSADIGTTKKTITFDNSVSLSAGENILQIKNLRYSGDTKISNGFFSFTFTSTEKNVNSMVSFVQTTNVDGHNDITVKSVTRGSSVPLTAHQGIDGYEFVGWKRGTNENDSAWVDIEGDSYNVWTNTFLTAIYKPTGGTTAAKSVDFWNQNGAYMGTAADEASYKAMVGEKTSLTGFGAFRGWFTDGKVQLTEDTVLSEGTTNAVAQYEDGVVSGVTLNGEAVAEANVYNKAIPFSASIDGFTCWKRDGKVISYDADYMHYVWDATAITEDDDAIEDKVPVAILEKNTDYNAYMFEYDDGDYTIVEAGIIFGDDATVDNCTNKYTSQRKVSHNQFTVPAENGTAKGYIIWKNASGAYQIDYFTEE